MSHFAPVVVSMMVDDDRRLYYTSQDVFNGLSVEDAWPFPSDLAAISFVDDLDRGEGDPDEVKIVLEYRVAAMAREDQERSQLAALHG